MLWRHNTQRNDIQHNETKHNAEHCHAQCRLCKVKLYLKSHLK